MSLLHPGGPVPQWATACYDFGTLLAKQAADTPELVYNLVGQLYHTQGWILLSVPNALVRGYYAAMREPGIELPPGPHGDDLNAHISVIRPDELTKIGGPDRVTERGKQFTYTTGRTYTVEPEWPDVAKVWYLRVHSPELQTLRRSYGLSSLPNEGQFDFHITLAVRRKKVLGRNDASKNS